MTQWLSVFPDASDVELGAEKKGGTQRKSPSIF